MKRASKRTVLLLVVVGTAMLLASGVALAKTVECKRDAKKCEGTRNDDVLRGTNSPDRIFGLRGQDILYGSGESDKLFGGKGFDQLVGETGDDTLYGGKAFDQLVGETGDDTLYGGKGGDDYNFGNAWGDDVTTDTAVVNSEIATGNAVIFYDVTGDVIVNLNSDSGSAPEATDGVNTVNWSCKKDRDPECDPNVIDLAKSFSDGNDKITGNSARNFLKDQDQTGNDTLSGGDGDDQIDSLDGSGSDTLSGGGGNDQIDSDDQSGSDTLSGGEGDDRVISFDESGNDTLSGGTGDDLLNTLSVTICDIQGGCIDTSGGNDTVLGEEGNDTINVRDGFGGDTVDCGEDVGGGDTDTVHFDDGDIISPTCENQNPPVPPGPLPMQEEKQSVGATEELAGRRW